MCTLQVNAAFRARWLTHPKESMKPNGNYFMENASVRFLFTKSKVAENKRVSTENEWGF